ncbi:MAG: nicotinamide-nucleotide amidohydrolase family protein, partial [Marinilabiliales bacterium]|nr:nicotinamide-nucleotide amidohydrolase family protein [Marinilabiliales bacterium]
ISVNKLNREQALVPAKALVFQNELGTAPGLLLKKERCTYIFMPGVPFEMKYLMEAEVLPYIRKNFQTSTIFHKTILTFGLPESMLAEKIEKWEDGLPDHIRLAYLPSPQGVKLRLSARGKPMDQMVQEVKEKVDRLLELIPGNIYGYDNENPALNLGRMLESNGWTLSTAESCTGGTIARMITDNPGSSAYFKGSVVAYANETKTKILGVKQSSLEQEGAVSASVVEQMAVNVCELLGTDFAMATSGIAGPGGGTGEKPVGTIWIAVARGSQVVSQCFNFGNDRERNMTRTAHQALFMLRNFILNLVQ